MKKMAPFVLSDKPDVTKEMLKHQAPDMMKFPILMISARCLTTTRQWPTSSTGSHIDRKRTSDLNITCVSIIFESP